jgi:RecA-family ATPase
MEQILISVLSVLVTLSVVLAIWMVNGIRKAHKNDNQHNNSIINLELSRDSIHNKLDEIIDNIASDLNERERITFDNMENMRSDMDRRFDKMYQKFYSDMDKPKAKTSMNHTSEDSYQINS